MKEVTYPVAFDLRGRLVVVVGAGPVAAQRVERLVGTGARIRVIAPRCLEELWEREARGEIEIVERTFRRGDLHGSFLVLAERVGLETQTVVFEEAEALGIPVNIEDDPQRCSFHVPSLVRRGHLQIAISTGGMAPALAVRLRQRLESDLDPAHERLVALAGSLRGQVAATLPDVASRRRAWFRLVDSDVLSLLASGRESEARDRALEVLGLGEASAVPEAPARETRPGIVHLVGAGPGDPELITVRGLRLLRRCEVVVYDRLVNPRLLDQVPASAERVNVGKEPGLAALGQEEITGILLDRARRGLRVVRLKGGDPFVFGRGGEEAAALARAGIAWEVVPAVSSALAVPARVGIPVTLRGVAASFAVVTGHRINEASEPDWEALARVDTLVILMGVGRLEAIVRRLLEWGRSPETPVAIVERGTLPDERVVTAPLGWIGRVARREGVRSPATIVVGKVVDLRETLRPVGKAFLTPEVDLLPRSVSSVHFSGDTEDVHDDLIASSH